MGGSFQKYQKVLENSTNRITEDYKTLSICLIKMTKRFQKINREGYIAAKQKIQTKPLALLYKRGYFYLKAPEINVINVLPKFSLLSQVQRVC